MNSLGVKHVNTGDTGDRCARNPRDEQRESEKKGPGLEPVTSRHRSEAHVFSTWQIDHAQMIDNRVTCV